jgi:hypothetical protein
MTDIATWTERNLKELIENRVQESLTIEYKSGAALGKSDSRKIEISKDISALANSAGGTIIYGIVETGGYPSAIDGVDPNTISREWVEQVVSSCSTPKIQGVRIAQIALASGKVAYALEIPQATTLAPHQAKDNRYYRRYNSRSIPMEDYEVRDVLRRASSPHLFLRFRPRPMKTVAGKRQYELAVDIGNYSNEPALYRVISLTIDERILVAGPTRFESTILRTRVGQDKKEIDIVRYRVSENIPEHMPIFKEYTFHLAHLVLRPSKSRRRIGFSLACPGFFTDQIGWISVDGSSVRIEGFQDA